MNSVVEFDKIIGSGEPVLVDYYADWCGPCRALVPNIEHVVAATAGRLRVVKVDVDSAPELAQRSRVGEIPALHFYRDGRKVAGLTGYRTADALLVEVVRHGLASAVAGASAAAPAPQPATSWASRLLGRLKRRGYRESGAPEASEPERPPTTFRLLESEQELADLLDRSFRETTVLFLHDPWCPISARAYRQMGRFGGEVAIIDVSRQRGLSMEVERRTGVRHESPQVIVLRDAIAIWDASHGRVTASVVREALARRAPPGLAPQGEPESRP